MLQIKIWEDRKTQPLEVLRPHDGHPVFSATFFTAPHQPDHIVLITAVSVSSALVDQVYISILDLQYLDNNKFYLHLKSL